MNTHEQTSVVSRSALFKMLSDEELISVSAAETAALLGKDEEFLDLAHLDKGVRRAIGKTLFHGPVLPKKGVSEKTWNKIVAQLPLPGPVRAPSRP